VLDALLDQPLPLATAAPPILLLGAGDPNHAADLRLAAMPRHQRAQQAGEVDPVGLAPAGAAVDQQARRVDDLIGDAVRHQEPVQPEAVVAGLIAGDDPYRPAEARFGPSARRPDQHQQGRRITAGDRVPADLVGHRAGQADQPLGLAQFQRHEQRGRLRVGGGCCG
jgi:hypothetical protein